MTLNSEMDLKSSNELLQRLSVWRKHYSTNILNLPCQFIQLFEKIHNSKKYIRKSISTSYDYEIILPKLQKYGNSS